MKLSNVVCSSVLAALSSAHSWVHCTDYRGDINYFSEGDCHGHPRGMNGELPSNSPFGTDRGFDEQVTQGCDVPQPADLDPTKMARYTQGGTYTLAWPSKNHVAAACTNPSIPDTSLELFIEPYTEGGDPDAFTQIVDASFTREPHERNTIDYQGFQHCPAFCENMDKSLCTGSFVVPQDLPDGVYTFQWRWVFNEGSAPYVTCFEAYIGQDVTPIAAPTNQPTVEGEVPATPAPTEDPGCVGEVALYGQCTGSPPSCCAGGSQCFRQSEYYSQCLMACPGGWECDQSTEPSTDFPTLAPTVSTPAPTPGATDSPTASSTPEPTHEVTPAPTAMPTTPVECGACQDGFTTKGKLKAPSDLLSKAIVESTCACSNMCSYVVGSAAFVFNDSTNWCKCYGGFRKIQSKNSGSSWVGEVVAPATI